MKASVIGAGILLSAVAVTSALHNWVALAAFFAGMICAAFFTYTDKE